MEPTPNQVRKVEVIMHKRTVLLLAMLLLFGAACNFSSRTPVAIVPTATEWVPPVVTETPVATTTAQPTQTPVPTNTSVAVATARPPVNCTIRTDWPVYVVQGGDTLGTLAQRTGSTVAQLVTANCLPNANLISVGQPLRVPRQPSPVNPPTPVPGPITVSPFLHYDHPTYFVQPFITLTIAWPDAARLGAAQAEFYFRSDAGPVAVSLGVDYDLTFDAAIQWVVPGNTRGEIWAVGRNQANTVESARLRVNTVDAVPGQPQPVTLDPYASFQNGTYRVKAEGEVLIGWSDPLSRTAATVEFFFYAGAYPSGQSLGVDPTMMDGASISWTVPAGTVGQVTARVRMPDGLVFETPPVGVVAE